MAAGDRLTHSNIYIININTLQSNRQLSDLAWLLSLSRCLVLRYMRCATSSMAHSLKNRPRFISVRMSKLQEGEDAGVHKTGLHNHIKNQGIFTIVLKSLHIPFTH